MKEHARPSSFVPGSKSKSKLSLILLLVPFVSFCGCVNDAFLPPPENLPYAQEHASDSNSDTAKMPPLLDPETF
jgi:hypothetical protein